MKREKIVAANWKMNKTFTDGLLLANATAAELQDYRGDVTIVLATPFIHLHTVFHILDSMPNDRLVLGAQNCHFEDKGAYTGEISIPMLQSVGAKFVIIGHSERREYFKEDNVLLAKKVNALVKTEIRPIFCFGEPLEIREQGTEKAFVKKQLEESLWQLSPEDFKKLVLAYEPIWAIGTGKTATPDQAQDMHAYIRQLIEAQYGEEVAQQTTIMYGGSCKPGNAGDLFAQPDVDGALVGGASLDAHSFFHIVEKRGARRS